MHEKLGVTSHHQPAMTMQASDLACSITIYISIMLLVPLPDL